MKDLRIAFLGTPDFAVASLKAIHEAGKQVVAVITAPDKKAGRGQQVSSSAVKQFALEAGLHLMQPTNLKDPKFLEDLKVLEIDLQIVVAFRMLPESVWNMPRLGTFNLHASLLPKYRGAAPINWAIINGEKETGVSTFFLKHEIDTGDLLYQEKASILPTDNAGTLHDKLMHVGADLVVKTIHAIEEGKLNGTPQANLTAEELEKFKAPKLFRETGQINWNLDPAQLDCFIRGLSPYPGAWTSLRQISAGKVLRLKVFSIQEVEATEPVTQTKLLLEKKNLFILSSKACYQLNEVQLEGKKRMDMASLLNGINRDDYELA